MLALSGGRLQEAKRERFVLLKDPVTSLPQRIALAACASVRMSLAPTIADLR